MYFGTARASTTASPHKPVKMTGQGFDTLDFTKREIALTNVNNGQVWAKHGNRRAENRMGIKQKNAQAWEHLFALISDEIELFIACVLRRSTVICGSCGAGLDFVNRQCDFIIRNTRRQPFKLILHCPKGFG